MGKTLDNYKNSFIYYIPWDFLLNDFILVNKNMGFQVTLKVRNHDLDFFTEEEMNLKILQYNNAIKKLPDNFIVHYEVQRKKSRGYIETEINDDFIPTVLMERERKDLFSKGEYFKCDYYITLTYLITEDAENKINSLLASKKEDDSEEKMAEEAERELKIFRQKVVSFIALLKYATTSIEVLQGDELMAYMYSTVNAEFPEKKKMPTSPLYPIDQYLSNSSFENGKDTKIQRLTKAKHLRTISVNLFPDEIESRVLKKLESLDFEFRMSARYIILSQNESKKMLKNFFIFHQGKQKNFGQYITEAITKKPSFNIDELELAKTEEAKMALNEFKEGGMSYGYYTFTVVLADEDIKRLEDNALKIVTIFDEQDFTCSIDKYNIFPSYLGAIPGNVKANIRKYPINSMLLSCLFPTSSLYRGEEVNEFFRDKKNITGVPLMMAKTDLNDIFYFNLHIKDAAHTLIAGPTRSGKSVLLGMLVAELKKYPNAQVFFFDKGGSIRVLTACMGGKFYDLGKGGDNDLAFQPLANIHIETERAFASNWIISLLQQENVIVTPDMKSTIWETLTTLSNDPPNRRTMTNFAFTVMNKEIQQALEPYTNIGSYGKYFDNNEDNFSDSNWQVFEMGRIIEDPKATAPILSYLFHRIEVEKLTKDYLTAIVVDEAWFAMENESFRLKFNDWLRTLAKLNAFIIFATQSLDEIAKSEITPAIVDGCKTKILLPSPQAKNYWKELYSKFGLNTIEIEKVARGEMQKQYFYKSDLGSREFEMDLGKIELAYVGSASSTDQIKIQEICAETNDLKEINLKWLEYKLGKNSQEFRRCKEIIQGGN